MRVRAVSPVYETEPWGVEPGSQPSYFNAVVLVRTSLPPSALLERGHAIEEAYLRVRTERWGPRTIDVDIVTYQDVVSDDPELTLPHPGPMSAPSCSYRGTTPTRRPRCPVTVRSPICSARSSARVCGAVPMWNSDCPSNRWDLGVRTCGAGRETQEDVEAGTR